MKLKTVVVNGATYAEVKDGRPVFVHDDGKETSFDVPDMYGKLSRDGKRNAELQRELEAAKTRLDTIGDLDPDAARKAMETIRNLDAGQMKTAAQVDEIKAEARKAAEEQVKAAAEANGRKIKELQGERDKLQTDFYNEKVGGAFSRSKFISEKVAVPGDMIQAMFGSRFKVEDGKTVGYDAAGNKMFSRAKPGEVADFDEALEMMVDSYAYRDSILKGSGSTGSGARPTNGGGGGKRTVSRAEYDKLPPMQQRAFALDQAKGTAAISD